MSASVTAQTFRALNGRPRWPTGSSSTISASVSGLRLEALPGGPLSLRWPDGSLGGLTLPRGFAFDDGGTVYLLDPPDPAAPSQHIHEFDGRTQTFVAVPSFGGWGTAPRRFRNASNISISGRLLFVADEGNRRIQVLSLDTLQLQYVWTVGADDVPARLDVASHGSTTYVLDGAGSRVLQHVVGNDEPKPFIVIAPGARQWSRIAIDRIGRIYLLDEARSAVDVYDRRGRWLQQVTDAGEVRDRFDPPGLTVLVNTRGGSAVEYFRLPEAVVPAAKDFVFDRRGRRVRLERSELILPKLYGAAGTWISTSIDSGIHACQWHRLDVEVPQLPPGTSVLISTFTSDTPTGHPFEGSPLWQPCLSVYGTTQPAASRSNAQRRTMNDALVQSREGRYLWLNVQLRSDGFDSPLVAGIDARFPRDSYLRYLPAVYSADDESRWFLERFLSIMQTDWEDIERRVREVRRYFDIEAAPDTGGWLETLARWMAVQLEQTWTPEQKRNLLRVSKRLLGRRGTPAGLRAFLQAYLQNMTRLSPKRQGRWPVIREAFRERQHVLLGAAARGVGMGTTLWSDAVVGRPQLDVFAQEGAMRLVSTGDPGRDLFHRYSHRFTVSVPAAWVRSDADERMLRRAIDAEKPAHTTYDLEMVAARFRVGIQSTVGVDTIVGGDRPCARLDGACTNGAPAQPPRNRLGYDTVLGRGLRREKPVQMPGSRIGVDTILH